MPRRKRVEKRELIPDPKYGSILATQFINGLMGEGEKAMAEKIFYRTLRVIEDRTGTNGLELFKKAINNVKPVLEVKSRRVGGATYQVPVEVRQDRRTALAIRWILSFAHARKGQPMVDRLAEELIQASRGEGSAIKKKEDTHKMAEANRAFAHYRW